MNKFGKTSLVLASVALPLTLLVSGIISWHLKGTNPDNVDITAGLAYLKPILTATLVTFGVTWVSSFLLGIIGLKKDTSKEFAKLGLSILLVVTALSLVAGIANKNANDAVDVYREEKTMRFFQHLE